MPSWTLLRWQRVKKVLPFHPPDTVELEGLSIEVPIKFWLR